jgi:hypothetical protein
MPDIQKLPYNLEVHSVEGIRLYFRGGGVRMKYIRGSPCLQWSLKCTHVRRGFMTA